MIHVKHDGVWSQRIRFDKKDFIRTENEVEPDLNRLKISNWLYNM